MSIIAQKRCTKCGVDKPLDQFNTRSDSPDGYRNDCKACKKAARYNTEPPRLAPGDIKTCSTCKLSKPVSEFRVCNTNRSGYTPRCKECCRASARKWHANNQEWIQAYEERHYEKLHHYRNEYSKKRNKRPDVIDKRRERDKSPKALIYSRNRNAFRRAKREQGDVTPESLQRFLDSQSKCCYCHKPFNSKRKKTVDHVIPISKGGLHMMSNLAIACLSCNSSKNNRLIRLI